MTYALPCQPTWNLCDCSAEAYDRVVDSIFNMPVDSLHPEEVPGTPNSFQVSSSCYHRYQHIMQKAQAVEHRHSICVTLPYS